MGTGVRGPTGTDEMYVDSSYVLFVDNNNKNDSAKLIFFAAMDRQSVGRLGGKVEEYTWEGEGTEDTASPITLSNGPYLPLTATGSSGQREGGTTGVMVEEYTSEGTKDMASPVALSKGPYLPLTATESTEQREGGTIGWRRFADLVTLLRIWDGSARGRIPGAGTAMSGDECPRANWH